MAAPDKLIIELRHGIELTVLVKRRQMPLSTVADFLLQAVLHFKHHRDDLKTAEYMEEPYRWDIDSDITGLSLLKLSYSAKHDKPFLTASLWADAVINAYANTDTIEQMLESLSAYREVAAKEGGWLLEVVNLLGPSDGEVQALKVMIENGLIRDQQSGHYKPGVVSGK